MPTPQPNSRAGCLTCKSTQFGEVNEAGLCPVCAKRLKESEEAREFPNIWYNFQLSRAPMPNLEIE
jgi:hypothetical protein